MAANIDYKTGLQWMVYRHDSNAGKIVRWDIFEHGGFRKEVANIIRQDLPYERFADALRGALLYYFWAKCEYEVVIKEWVGNECELKVDIFSQVNLNFDVFAHYVWSATRGVTE